MCRTISALPALLLVVWHELGCCGRRKIAESGDDVVLPDKNGPPGSTLTLKNLCERINLNPANLSTDSLGCHADSSTYQRFDRFNDKYNPFGHSLLREVFMKTDNYMSGRYFAGASPHAPRPPQA